MNNKPINQNPDRYTYNGDGWTISASPNVKSIYLPKGVEPSELLPVLTADGIIVEVGEYKLISQTTLNNIESNKNPHYDIVENGTINGVSIGQVIPTIKINLDSLSQSANERDILNRNAGVTSVQYIYQDRIIPNTDLSQNLVDQINYTLSPDYNRPKDTYFLADLQLSPADAYNIRTKNALTEQDLANDIFSYSKLEDFLKSTKENQEYLQSDFTLIREVFYEGKLPADLQTYKVTKMATAEDKVEEGDVQIVYKNSQLISIVPKEPKTSKLPPLPPSNVKLHIITGRTGFGMTRVKVFLKDPTSPDNKDKKVTWWNAGTKFIGSYYKDYEGRKLFKAYDQDGITVIGYPKTDDTNDIVEFKQK